MPIAATSSSTRIATNAPSSPATDSPDGIAPGCGVEVHALSGGARDALFHPVDGPTALDSQLALAALSGRIGGDPAALLPAYLTPLKRMQGMLFPCLLQPCTEIQEKKNLLATKPSLSFGTGDHLVELKGPAHHRRHLC